MYKILTSYISDYIDIDRFAEVYSAELLYSDHVERFYEVGTELYVSIFRYGTVCFFNHDNEKITEFIQLISYFCSYFYDSELNKEYIIETNSNELKFGFNHSEFTYFDIDALRLVMLNLSQSVALDAYMQHSRVLLEQTSKHTGFLEKNGKLDISDLELKKFIGKTHNLKNHIIENLHVIDSLPENQQNDFLLKVDFELKNALYLDKRFGNIYRELETVREHLDYFSDLVNNGRSLKLEWVIIVLLLIFVLNILLSHIKF